MLAVLVDFAVAHCHHPVVLFTWGGCKSELDMLAVFAVAHCHHSFD